MQKPINIVNLELLKSIIKEDYANSKKYLLESSVDFNSFANFAAYHKLSGYLYSIISNSPLRDAFPLGLIKDLKLSYIKQWSKNEKLLREIKILNKLSQKEDYDMLFLKGPFLAQHFYGNIDRRLISDIDILVKSKKDVEGLNSLLSEYGFKRQSLTFINKDLTYYFTHHFEYKKQAINLDLHWALQSHFTFNFNYKKIWDKKQEISLQEQSFAVLSDEYTLVIILLAIFMDIQYGGLYFKSLIDAYMILKAINKAFDWELFFENRKKEGLFLISFGMLDLVINSLECHDEFKELTSYIEKNKTVIKYRGLGYSLNIFNRSRYSISAFRSKLWAFKLYDSPVIMSFFWWIVSGFWRIMVCRNNNPRILNKLVDCLS